MITKVCSACGKPIIKGQEYSFFMGKTEYLCPKCYGRGNINVGGHEIDVGTVYIKKRNLKK